MRISIVLLFATVIVFTSCAPFKMSVSDELKAGVDEYPVKGRQGLLINQKLTFGDYKTSKVKRSWTKGSTYRSGWGWWTNSRTEWVNIISTDYINRKQTLNFTMEQGELQSEVFGVSKFYAEDLNIGRPDNLFNFALDLMGKGGTSESFYYVQVFTKNDERPWELALDNQASMVDAKQYKGYFAKSANEYYSIKPVYKIEKNGKSGNILAGSIGFEITNAKGQPVAAVSMMDKGMVFLGKTSQEEKFLMANLCAALLLRQEIEN